MRTIEQVLHDSLQEWNVEEFAELDWNNRAATAAIKALNDEGYVIAPEAMMPVEPAPAPGNVVPLPVVRIERRPGETEPLDH